MNGVAVLPLAASNAASDLESCWSRFPGRWEGDVTSLDEPATVDAVRAAR